MTEEQNKEVQHKKPEDLRKLILWFRLSPGDIMTGTAALFNMHITKPTKYTTKVRTPVPEIFENNPFVYDFPDSEADALIEMHYPDVHRSDTGAYCFINSYTDYLSRILNTRFTYHTNKPMIFLSEEEKNRHILHEKLGLQPTLDYAIVDAGVKLDYPIKQWPIEYYQAVIFATRDIINWVQIGSLEHAHTPLQGVVNMLDQTNDVRSLFCLVNKAKFGLGPITFLMHCCAAFDKPYICIDGGRECPTWVSYPKQHTLHTVGLLDCCNDGGCWVSKAVPEDTFPENNNRLCKYPLLDFMRPVGKCMAMIKPQDVISLIRRMKDGNLW